MHLVGITWILCLMHGIWIIFRFCDLFLTVQQTPNVRLVTNVKTLMLHSSAHWRSHLHPITLFHNPINPYPTNEVQLVTSNRTALRQCCEDSYVLHTFSTETVTSDRNTTAESHLISFQSDIFCRTLIFNHQVIQHPRQTKHAYEFEH